MPGPSYQTPSRSTFPFGRIPIVDKNGYPTQDYARYMTALEAKTNQTLSVQGNVTLNNIVTGNPTVFNPTTNTSTLALLEGMEVTLVTKGRPVLLLFTAQISNDTIDGQTLLVAQRDGVGITSANARVTSSTVNAVNMAVISVLDIVDQLGNGPAPGTHVYRIMWGTLGVGISQAVFISRNLQVIELG